MSTCNISMEQKPFLRIVGNYVFVNGMLCALRKEEGSSLPFRIPRGEVGWNHAENILWLRRTYKAFDTVESLAKAAAELKVSYEDYEEPSIGIHLAVANKDGVLTMGRVNTPVPRNVSGPGQCCLAVSFRGVSGIRTCFKTIPIRFKDIGSPYELGVGRMYRGSRYGNSPNPFSTFVDEAAEDGKSLVCQLENLSVELVYSLIAA